MVPPRTNRVRKSNYAGMTIDGAFRYNAPANFEGDNNTSTFVPVPTPRSWRVKKQLGCVGWIGVIMSFVRVIGTFVFLGGAAKLHQEAVGLKFDIDAWNLKWYVQAYNGWMMIAIGTGLIAAEQFVIIFLAAAVRISSPPNPEARLVERADSSVHPELTPLDVTRNLGHMIGNLLVVIGATITAYKHPTFDGVHRVIDLGESARWYNARDTLHGSLWIVVAGMLMRSLVPAIQFFAGEGFNVCYICPVARCWFEVGAAAGEGSVGAAIKRTYATLPVGGGTIPCAVLLHNWFGAARMHVYLSSILMLAGAISYAQSAIDPYYYPFGDHANTQEVWERVHATTLMDSPTSDPNSIYLDTYKLTLPPSTADDDAPYHDSSYYMWMGSRLLLAAAVFQIVSAIAYAGGVLRREASLPGNHVPTRNALWWLWP
jgi:hypothetical protein